MVEVLRKGLRLKVPEWSLIRSYKGPKGVGSARQQGYMGAFSMTSSYDIGNQFSTVRLAHCCAIIFFCSFTFCCTFFSQDLKPKQDISQMLSVLPKSSTPPALSPDPTPPTQNLILSVSFLLPFSMSEPTVGRARGYSGRSVGKTASNISRTTSNTPKSPLPPVLSPTDWMDKATEALMVDPSDKKQPQRRRGTSFRDEYRALKNGGRTRVRAPSMIHEPTKDHMIPPQRKELRNKYTIVLDLDETLIYARDGPLFARPHLDLLFALLKEHCETVVWTAGVKAYAQTIIRNIDPSNTIEHCIYRHKKWFSGKAGYQKDLTLLGRNMDHVLIIENTPDCVRGNPSNGVLVADYVCSGDGSQVDPTIPTLTHFIARLIESGKTVPEFLATTDMLSETEMMTDVGDSYDVYTLNSKQLAVTVCSPFHPLFYVFSP